MMVMEIINKVVMASLHANNSQPVKDRAERVRIKGLRTDLATCRHLPSNKRHS